MIGFNPCRSEGGDLKMQVYPINLQEDETPPDLDEWKKGGGYEGEDPGTREKEDKRDEEIARKQREQLEKLKKKK